MYLRFVTPLIHPHSRVESGFFRASWYIHRNGCPDWIRQELSEQFNWFGQHLPIPGRIARHFKRRDSIWGFAGSIPTPARRSAARATVRGCSRRAACRCERSPRRASAKCSGATRTRSSPNRQPNFPRPSLEQGILLNKAFASTKTFPSTGEGPDRGSRILSSLPQAVSTRPACRWSASVRRQQLHVRCRGPVRQRRRVLR